MSLFSEVKEKPIPKAPTRPIGKPPPSLEQIHNAASRMFSGSPAPEQLFRRWLRSSGHSQGEAERLMIQYEDTLDELEFSMAEIIMTYAQVFLYIEYSEAPSLISHIEPAKRTIRIKTTAIDKAVRSAVLSGETRGLDAMRGAIFHEAAHYMYDPTVPDNGGLTEIHGRQPSDQQLLFLNAIYDTFIEVCVSKEFPYAEEMLIAHVREHFEEWGQGNVDPNSYVLLGHRHFVTESFKEAARKLFVYLVGAEQASEWDQKFGRLVELRDVYPRGSERAECLAITKWLMDFLDRYVSNLSTLCTHGHGEGGHGQETEIPDELRDELVAAARKALEEMEQDPDKPEERAGLEADHSILKTASLQLPEITPSVETVRQLNYELLEPPEKAAGLTQYDDAYQQLSSLLVSTSLDMPGTMVGDLDLECVIESASMGYSKPNMFSITETTTSAHGDVFILIGYDCSASMKGVAHHVAAWKLKQLFDQLRLRCGVIAWSETAGVLYQSDEECDPSKMKLPMLRGNGTVPRKASKLAYEIFSLEPRQQHRLWLNMTDGDWRTGDTYTTAMRQDLDVLTSLTLLKRNLPVEKSEEWFKRMLSSNHDMFGGYQIRNLALSVGEVADHIVGVVTQLVGETAIVSSG